MSRDLLSSEIGMSYHRAIVDLSIFTVPHNTPLETIDAGIFPEEPDLVKVQRVTVDKFRKWEKKREHPFSPKVRLFFYSAELETIIFKLPLTPHEYLHAELFFHITKFVVRHDLDEEVIASAASRYRNPQPGFTSSGEGDSSLSLDPPSRNNGFPTVVIESGWSQSLEAIRAKTRWWFHMSNGAVRIVIVAVANRSQRTITIEKWKLATQTPRAGATMTPSFSAAREPACLHTITITQNDQANILHSYQMTGAPLTLEFQDMFLREPVPPETDVVIGERHLGRCARRVWEAVDRGP